MQKAYTGGELNWLNGKYGISAPQNSVPIMQLIRNHQPQTSAELIYLIKSHAQKHCDCGIISKGSITDFGRNLYMAQYKAWKKFKYSLQACIQWEYDLFIKQSMLGNRLEQNAIKQLSKLTHDFAFREARGSLDEDYRIDLLVIEKKHGNILAGVQIKPGSFRHIRTNVVRFNLEANKKWGKPVFYLFYDSNSKFINLNRFPIFISHLKK